MGQCVSGGRRGKDSFSIVSDSSQPQFTLTHSDSDSSIQSGTGEDVESCKKYRKVRKYQPILIKSGQKESSRRAKFFILSSKTDMKKTNRKSKNVAHPVTSLVPESRPIAPEILRNSPNSLKRKQKNFVVKSVTFSEPENKPEKTSKLRNRRRHRKPLIAVNVDHHHQEEDSTFSSTRNVSKVPFYFKFSASKHDGDKNIKNPVSSPPPALTVLTENLTKSEDVTNDTTKCFNVDDEDTMGMYFRDDDSEVLPGSSTATTTTTTTLKYYSEQLLEHGGSRTYKSNKSNNNNHNGAINIKIQESINSASLINDYAAKKINTNNNNINLNHHSSNEDDVKSAEIIREENRLRRNLFFGSPDLSPPPPSTTTVINTAGSSKEYLSSGNLNMNNGFTNYNNNFNNNKNSLFGFNHHHIDVDMKSKLQDQPILNRQEPISSASVDSGIPKLYSVNNSNLSPQQQQSQLYGKNLRGSQSTTQLLPTSSKLSTFASGSNIRYPGSSMINNKPNNNTHGLNHRSILQQNNLMKPVPPPRHIDLSKKDDSKVTQWISANDFFKQQPNPPPHPTAIVNKLPVSSQHGSMEPRRETLPAKFGYGYNNNSKSHGPQLLSTRKNLFPASNVMPTTTTVEESRRETLNPVRKIPTYNFGLKRPVQSKPFYELGLYQNRTARNIIPPSSVTGTSKNASAGVQGATVGGFQGVSTGLVKMAASNYQKIIDETSSPFTVAATSTAAKVVETNPHSLLIRSATWVISSSADPTSSKEIQSNDDEDDDEDDGEIDRKENISIDSKGQKSSPSSSQPGMSWEQPTTTMSSSLNYRLSNSSSNSGDHELKRGYGGPSTHHHQHREQHRQQREVGDSGQRRSKVAIEVTLDDNRTKSYLVLPNELEGTNTLCNYPIIRDGSTSSSIISSEEPTSLHSHAPTDHDKAISDSEFLIDDEIADQPDLTLTFKDSSLILSSSSSGESLVSCDLMLDYKDSTCGGLLSSDSTLLDETSLVSPSNRSSMTTSIVSSEVLSSSCGIPQKIMVNSSCANNSGNGGRRSLGYLGGGSQVGGINNLSSSIPTTTTTSPSNKVSSPSNKASYVSHRDRVLSNQLQNQQQNQNNNCSSQRQVHSGSQIITNSAHKTGKFISAIPSPIHDNSPTKGIGLENHLNVSNTNTKLRQSLSKSPLRNNLVAGRQIPPPRTPSPIVPKSPGLKSNRGRGETLSSHRHHQHLQQQSPQSHQQQQQSPSKNAAGGDVSSEHEESEQQLVSSLSDSFVKEILTEVLECRKSIEELKSVLETTEKEIIDKDDIISRQQKEIEYWKSTALSGGGGGGRRKSNSEDDKEMNSIIREDRGDYRKDKEKEITSTKETKNTAVQTENNYTVKPIIYPDEHDKIGQLVSFRIGRKSSSTSNQS